MTDDGALDRNDRPSAEELRRNVDRLGEWYQNIDLGEGVLTRPNHPDGNHPQDRLDFVAPFLPVDLEGKSVLDIGCNAGFFSLEMKRRGARRVLGIDSNPRFVEQARFAARHLELDVEYREMDCYEIGDLGEQFDVVVFFGVLYHLRHPLLALDLIRSCCRELMLFQTVMWGFSEPIDIPEDFGEREGQRLFSENGFPRLYFIEHQFKGDTTNWFVMNRNAALALLRAADFQLVQETAHPEILLVYPSTGPDGAQPLRGFEARTQHRSPTRLQRVSRAVRNVTTSD
jgi:tRNA (mo5U34)-methyltransferase